LKLLVDSFLSKLLNFESFLFNIASCCLSLNYLTAFCCIYHRICSNTLIFALWYFSLFKLKVFSNRLPLVCLSFHVMKVIAHRLPCLHSRSFTPFQEVRYFLDPFLHLPFVYVPCTHQFDSFLDWEGYHWDFSSSRSSPHHSQFPPLLQLLPMHFSRYILLIIIIISLKL